MTFKMVEVKTLFVEGAPFEDRVELFPTDDKKEAVLMAAEKLTIEEVKNLFSFEISVVEV